MGGGLLGAEPVVQIVEGVVGIRILHRQGDVGGLSVNELGIPAATGGASAAPVWASWAD